MKPFFQLTLLCITITLASCGQKSHDHEGHDHEHGHDHKAAFGVNQGLYDDVMKLHNEVMPKMGELHKLKRELKKKIEESKDLTEENKKEMEATIAKLDSASAGMMTWMHEFRPEADSTAGEEKVREYLEREMEKVKKVKADILGAIEKAKSN